MARQRRADLDPSLAEDAALRQERHNREYLDLLKDAGAIAVHGAERMGDIAAEGIQKIPEAYRAHKKFKMDKEAHDIRVENSRAQQERDRAEDEYWNGSMPEDYSVSVEPAPVKPHTVVGGVDFGYQKPQPQGTRQEFNMTDRSFLPRNQGKVSSPGAARVLDGEPARSMPAEDAGIPARQNTPIAGQPATPLTGPYQQRKILGGIDYGKAEDAGPPSDFNMAAPPWENQRKKPLTRRQHMLELQMQKDEQELALLKQGKGKGNQPVEWMYTKDFTADGRPILFNRLTGVTKVAEGVQGVPRTQGKPESQSLIDLRKAQAAAAQARADAIKTGKPTGGAASEWQPTGSVDEQGRPLSFNKRTGEYKVLGAGVKVKPKATGEDKITDSQRTAAMYYNNADEALKRLEAMEARGYRPGLGTAVKKSLTPDAMEGYVLSPDEQAYQQAAEDFTAAKLRQESGASIPMSEIQQQARIYMLAPGNDKQTIAQKQASRRTALESMKYKAGRGGEQIKAGAPEEKIIGGKRYRKIGPNQWQEVK